MPKNSWIDHVKAYAKEHNITYNCAISHAKTSYVKKTNEDKANDKLLEAQKAMVLSMMANFIALEMC